MSDLYSQMGLNTPSPSAEKQGTTEKIVFKEETDTDAEAVPQITVEVATTKRIASSGDDFTAVEFDNTLLVNALGELSQILGSIETMKKRAKSIEEWRAIMLYIAGVKPRVSELTSQAKRIYAQQFGAAWDAQFTAERKPNQKAAEIRAKSYSSLAYEASERFERTSRDLQDLMWACKSVADGMMADQNSSNFEAFPESLFPNGPQ